MRSRFFVSLSNDETSVRYSCTLVCQEMSVPTTKSFSVHKIFVKFQTFLSASAYNSQFSPCLPWFFLSNDKECEVLYNSTVLLHYCHAKGFLNHISSPLFELHC